MWVEEGKKKRLKVNDFILFLGFHLEPLLVLFLFFALIHPESFNPLYINKQGQYLIYLYNLCLFVWMSGHNSGTPGPICLKFWLENPGEPWECLVQRVYVEWVDYQRERYLKSCFSKCANTAGVPKLIQDKNGRKTNIIKINRLKYFFKNISSFSTYTFIYS